MGIKGIIHNIFGHITNILVHKYWVMKYGREIGLCYWQLFKHDLSKFSPIEFKESVKFYKGESSPIPECKKYKGYSNAWQHHKGRNSHHYEYWTDYIDGELKAIPMPYNFVLELIADWMAAGRTYMGKSFTFEGQCGWWENKKKENPLIHPVTISLIDHFFNKKYTYKDMANFFKKCHYEIKREYIDNCNNINIYIE